MLKPLGGYWCGAFLLFPLPVRGVDSGSMCIKPLEIRVSGCSGSVRCCRLGGVNNWKGVGNDLSRTG